MIRIELNTAIGNVQFRQDPKRNVFYNASSFVFYVVDPRPRKRIFTADDGIKRIEVWAFRARLVAPPASVTTKKLRPRRLRADMTRGAMLQFRADGGPVSWKQVDDAYLIVARHDGCGKGWLAFRHVSLYLGGIVRRLWRYWKVPAPPPMPLHS